MGDTSEPARRWYRLTPGRFITGLLAVEVFLALSERFQWLPINQHKGWTVLMAAGVLAAAFLLLLLWFALALVFRLHFQYSIRSLLILTITVAVPCSWLAREMKKAEEQRKARLRLGVTRENGTATYDWEVDSEFNPLPSPRPPVPPAPGWLRRLLGDDFFESVVGVLLAEVRDDDFAAVEQLTQLNSLGLLYSHVTDDGLGHIKALTQLRCFWIYGADVTDAGVSQLRGLAKLQGLGLGATPVSDAGIELLRDLPELKSLYLRETRVTDAGLERLSHFAHLQELDLTLTRITDAGLEKLGTMKELRQLHLGDTKVTSDGVNRLQRQLPECEIDTDPAVPVYF
ncbi:MAG: hypothetical protein ABR915_15000 [Thermoguttaceae bacterium]